MKTTMKIIKSKIPLIQYHNMAESLDLALMVLALSFKNNRKYYAISKKTN